MASFNRGRFIVEVRLARTPKTPPGTEPAAGDDPSNCRRCDLWRHATQAVDGEGEGQSHLMLVGEQPGDEEDLRGHPFVGPAGRLLDEILLEAGLDRRRLFITNAVKHFKWELRGKRRLHKKPVTAEIVACGIWLEREIDAVRPRVIVALGATALRALSGSPIGIAVARGKTLHHPAGPRIIASYHPSAILRADEEPRRELRRHLVHDLRLAARIAAESGSPR